MGFCGIPKRAISKEMPKIIILDMSLKNYSFKIVAAARMDQYVNSLRLSDA